MKFKELVFELKDINSPELGTQARCDFDNGYGASVIKGGIAYGSERAPYELAVFEDGGLCYSTPITDDVIGYLTESDVEILLNRIEAL